MLTRMEPSIQKIEPRHIIGVRTHVSTPDIGDMIGKLMPVIMRAAGPHASGPLLARWFGWEGDQGEMEVAIPVRQPLEASGECQPSELPGGHAAVVEYVGSYEGLPAAWVDFKNWLEAHGHMHPEGEKAVAPWEEYLSDCSVTPSEELVTRIVWPLGER